MTGPREGSPAGSGDEPVAAQQNATIQQGATARQAPTGWWMAVALPLGVFAIAWPLGMSASGPAGVGWASMTAGVSAVSIAVWYRRSGGGLTVPSIAGVLGAVGTFLWVWSLAAAGLPGTVPAPPALFGTAASGSASVGGAAGSPACRVESPEPAPAADGTVTDRTRADAVRGIAALLADAVCVQADDGGYPDGLTVAGDRSVRSSAGPLGSLPSGMVLEYTRTSTGFVLTVSDESGMPSDSIEFR